MRGLQFTLSFFACIGTMNGGDSVEAARPSPNTPSVPPQNQPVVHALCLVILQRR